MDGNAAHFSGLGAGKGSIMKKVFLHGSGHKASSWKQTVSYMENVDDILCPDLSSILREKEATYENLYTALIDYCSQQDGPVHLCGLSLGGILALNYAAEFPEKVKTLVLIGTPYKVPKVTFGFQNMIFRLLPKSIFQNMAFDKQNTFILGDSMKTLDFSGKVQSIQCPTLIICGEKDSANIKSAYYLSQNIKGATLKLVEKAGHVVNEENPKVLANILNGFYRTQQSAV